MKFTWWKFVPLLYVDIRIPFIRIYTSMMHTFDYKMELEYVALGIEVCKWKFNFSLYNTYKRIRRDA